MFSDELMEPSYTGPNHDISLTASLLRDIGWELDPFGFIDVVIVIDMTGSTGGKVGNWYAQLPIFAEEWQKLYPNVRFALVTHADYPFEPYGEPDVTRGEQAYKMEVNFTNGTIENLKDAFTRLAGEQKYGWDSPESQYETIYQVLTNGEKGIDLVAPWGSYTAQGEVMPSPLAAKGEERPVVIYHFTYPYDFHNAETEPNYPTAAYNSAKNSSGEFVVHARKSLVENLIASKSATGMFFGLTFPDTGDTLRRSARRSAAPSSSLVVENAGDLGRLAALTGGAVLSVGQENDPEMSDFQAAIKESVKIWVNSPQGARSLGKSVTPEKFSLQVSRVGEGKLTLQGVECSTDCTGMYDANTEVKLVATPTDGYQFANWSGDCTTDTITMDKAKSCTAVFTAKPVVIPEKFPLQVSRVGEGKLTLQVSRVGEGKLTLQGVECSTDCTEMYDANTEVKLVATPVDGYQFANWSGDCTTDTITMDKAKSCTAVFTAKPVVTPDGNYTAKGVLKDKLGKPLANVSVTVAGKTTTTDLTGSWSIGGLVEGKYDMVATANNFSCVNSGFEMGNEDYLQTVSCSAITSLKLTGKPQTWNTIYQGQEITHFITVTNGGSQTATGLSLKNVLSTGSTLVTIKTPNGGTCDAITGICTLPDLKVGESIQIELVVKANNIAGLGNKVTLTSNEYPPSVQNIWNDVKPHLSSTTVCKPKPVASEGTLNCKVTVEWSPFAPEKVTKVVSVNIQAPKGTTLASISNKYGDCDTSAHPKLACTIGELSIETPTSISRKTIEYSVKIADSEMVAFVNDSKVSTNGYPEYTSRDRTSLLVPEVKADIIIALDTTGSMRKFWSALKLAITQFIDSQINSKQSPTIALIDFKDDVTVRYFGSDMLKLKKIIEGLDISGGGLCPEASVEALELAAKHIKDYGMLALITDAPPYPDINLDAFAEKFGTLIADKHINFVFPFDKLGCSIDQDTLFNGLSSGLNR